MANIFDSSIVSVAISIASQVNSVIDFRNEGMEEQINQVLYNQVFRILTVAYLL